MKTIQDYLQEAHHDPRLRRTTHHYISDMIEHYGRDRVFEGVYGMEKQLDAIVSYFRAHSLSMERRLLLLVGPQGSGKSMTVDRLKRKLEQYSHTSDGALYAVEGCPFHQHPFDLIPIEAREEQRIYWHEEAVPCPICDRLIDKHNGWRQVPVTRIYISARDKIGIAKHTPTDLRREDITNFVGNINFAIDNSTAERLAEWFAANIVRDLESLGALNIRRVTVGVEEAPGQAGWFIRES